MVAAYGQVCGPEPRDRKRSPNSYLSARQRNSLAVEAGIELDRVAGGRAADCLAKRPVPTIFVFVAVMVDAAFAFRITSERVEIVNPVKIRTAMLRLFLFISRSSTPSRFPTSTTGHIISRIEPRVYSGNCLFCISSARYFS